MYHLLDGARLCHIFLIVSRKMLITIYIDSFQANLRPWYGVDIDLIAFVDDVCREPDNSKTSPKDIQIYLGWERTG